MTNKYDSLQAKNDALAEFLYQKARAMPHFSAQVTEYMRLARVGYYYQGRIRPAFLGDVFGMTDQDWDAAIALIYG